MSTCFFALGCKEGGFPVTKEVGRLLEIGKLRRPMKIREGTGFAELV